MFGLQVGASVQLPSAAQTMVPDASPFREYPSEQVIPSYTSPVWLPIVDPSLELAMVVGEHVFGSQTGAPDQLLSPSHTMVPDDAPIRV